MPNLTKHLNKCRLVLKRFHFRNRTSNLLNVLTAISFYYFPGGDAQASLAYVLAFATGAEIPPIMGFDTIPTIKFNKETCPTTNTCATILRLPTTYEEYEDFKAKMDFAILNSPCFGQA